MSLRAQRWKQIIIECNTSGMKKADWMRLHGVSEKSFYRWQTALRNQILKEVEEKITCAQGQETPNRENQQQNPDSGFVDITALTARRDSFPTMNRTGGPIVNIMPEIMIQAGPYNLYIGSGITEATLATVLKVIGNA